MSKKLAVIGLGNTLRRDDGIGILILESLLSSYAQPQVAYLNFGIASFDLIHRLEEYGAALLIDGINAGLAPGALEIFALEDAESRAKETAISTHELTLTALFELSGKFRLKTKIYVAGIQVQEAGFGEGLSVPLQRTFDNNVLKIRAFISTLL